jgi:DNA repair exonuclease SbcCD ATPase subunit
MKSLADQILELQLEVANLKRAAGYLKKLEKQLLAEQAGIAKLEQKVGKEYQDILNLQKKSFLDLFLNQQEEKAERLKKAQQEYHDAVVQLKDAEKAIKLIEFEIEILREKVSKLPEKELQLRQLKLKKNQTIELSVKKESDKTIVLKNRFKIASHKLMNSGRKIQVYLEEMENALNQIETWQNWDLSQPEKMKIFEIEFEKIEKALHKQNHELLHYNIALKNLSKFEKFINSNDRKDLKKIIPDCNALKRKLELFAEKTLIDLSKTRNLQNELTKLKAKIVEIQHAIDQTIRLLQTKNP